MTTEEKERQETARRLSKKWDENPLVNSMPCVRCRHYIIGGKKHFICKAYPDGIPNVITSGEVDHKKPHPGDNGIQFDKAPIDFEFEKFKRKLKSDDDDS